ncbi:MAG: MFS transporter [Acidimicrobiales bacterium]
MRHAWTTVAVVILAAFQTTMTLSAVFVVFVDLGDYFPDATNSELSWAINAFTIVSASTVVLGAAIGDQWGRKRTTLTGTLIFAVGSIVAGTAPGVGILILGRSIQALGAALAGPSSIALVLEAFPFEKRGIAIGVFTMGGGLAAALGPSLGGVIVEHLGWRWAFLAVVPVGLVSVVLGAVVFTESFGTRRERLPDPLGSLMLMFGVGSLILALVQTDEWGWADSRTIAAAVTGLVLITALLRRSMRHPAPIIDLGLYRLRTFRAGNGGLATFAASFFTMQFAAIFFLTEVWGYEIGRAGLLAAPFFLTTGLMGPIAGRAVDRAGPRPVATLGAGLWTVAMLVLAVLISDEPDVTMWLIVVVTSGVGSGLFWGATPTLTMEELDGHGFASASGINQTMQNTGNAFAIAIAITLLGNQPSLGEFTPVFAMVVGFGALSAAVLWTAGARADDPTPELAPTVAPFIE